MFSEPVRSDYATYSAFAMATLGYAIVVGRHVDATCRGGDHICRGGVGYDVGGHLQGVLEGFVSAGPSRVHGAGECRSGVVSGPSDLVGSVVAGGDDGSVCVDRGEASVEEGARDSFECGVGYGASAVVEDVSAKMRGKHYESNRRKRMIRKAKKASCRGGVCGVSGVASRACVSDDWRSSGPDSDVGVNQNVPTLAEFVSAKIDEEFVDSRALEVEMKVAERVAMQKAKKTLADKWAIENELAAAKAKRSLEVLMAQDVQAEIKKQATYLKLQTEKNMVGMEKAHQFLKKTGNVPGFAQTVLSDEGLTDGSSASPASPGECTISPDSSASMKEFREVVKQKADLEEKLARICKMTKVSLEDLDDYDKNTWSLKSENYEKLDRMYPGGYILDPVPDYVDYDPPTHGYLKF